jgi:hypothetical protein
MGDPDYRTLPPTVRIDATIASVDTAARPDSDDVRNVDQHAALRDD